LQLPSRLAALEGRASGATSATTTSVAVDDRLPELPADAREAQLAKNIERLLSKEHVRGQVVGDAVSKDAFPKYLEELDGGKLFLLASDVRALSAYAEKMDDELRDGDLTLARKGGACQATPSSRSSPTCSPSH
jgi:hypothetical protein